MTSLTSSPLPVWLLDINNNNNNDNNNNNATLGLTMSTNGNNVSFHFRMPDPFNEEVIIALAIVRLCLAVFGFILNVVAAAVLTNRKLWSPTSMLLLSLVIYDAFYLLLMIPVSATSISANIQLTPARYSTLRTIMALCFPLRYMAQMASIYTTVTVTLERYLVILLPLKASAMWTHGKTRRTIIGILLFSVLFNLPRCFDHILSQSPGDAADSFYQDSSSAASSSSAPPFSSSSLSSASADLNNLSLAENASSLAGDPLSLATGVLSASGSDVSGNGSVLGMRGEMLKTSASKLLSALVNGSRAEGLRSNGGDLEAGSSTVDGVLEGLHYFYTRVYLSYLTVIFLYLLPYTLIPVLNIQLVFALQRRKEEKRRLSIKKEHRLTGPIHLPADKEEGLTYISFGITFCFFVCCILPVVYMISTVASDNSNNFTSIYLLNAAETTLVVNAATDFFFYCLLGRKFRRVFLSMFCPERYIKKTRSITMRSPFSYSTV